MKIVRIDENFIAETIARTGSEQLLNKSTRSYVGLYDEETSWYIPLRSNLGRKKLRMQYLKHLLKQIILILKEQDWILKKVYLYH